MTMAAPEPFAMVVATRPRSGNKPPHSGYTRRIKEAAISQGARILGEPLYARIIWFQLERERNEVDADNIAKRILDALARTVFVDDGEVVRCLAVKTVADASGSFPIDPVQVPSPEVLATLQGMLETERNVLYIEIGQVTEAVIGFGPVR